MFNMRYRDFVEDKVYHLLSDPLEDIFQLSGQNPAILKRLD